MAPRPPFSGWAGPKTQVRLLVLGEAWGADELRCGGRPFAGAAGKELWLMMGEAWSRSLAPEAQREWQRVTKLLKYDLAWVGQRERFLEQTGVAFTNVFNLRPSEASNELRWITCAKSELPAGYDLPALQRSLYLRPEFLGELDRLRAEIQSARPNLILAAGNTACWFLLRSANISSIRGTITQSVALVDRCWKVLPTYHPAGVLYQYPWRPIVKADLMKAWREMQSSQIRRPQRKILVNPSIEEWEQRCYELARRPGLLACDTETSLGMIDTLGFADSRSGAFVCQLGPHRKRVGERYETVYPQRDGRSVASYWSQSEELRFWRASQALLESGRQLLFQNGVYDLQYLMKLGIRPHQVAHDTMLLHHSLFPELQKGLGFLGSIYTDEPAWKLMQREVGDSVKRDE